VRGTLFRVAYSLLTPPVKEGVVSVTALAGVKQESTCFFE
jgi:hypothetical protein